MKTKLTSCTQSQVSVGFPTWSKLVLPGPGDYRRAMRILAALALLLQLQPLIGSVICFHDAEMANVECTMPHQVRPASGTLAAPTSGNPGGCPSMGYCAPAAPAVPKLGERFQITPLVHSASALHYSSLTPGEPLGPPFHPPKA